MRVRTAQRALSTADRYDRIDCTPPRCEWPLHSALTCAFIDRKVISPAPSESKARRVLIGKFNFRAGHGWAQNTVG